MSLSYSVVLICESCEARHFVLSDGEVVKVCRRNDDSQTSGDLIEIPIGIPQRTIAHEHCLFKKPLPQYICSICLKPPLSQEQKRWVCTDCQELRHTIEQKLAAWTEEDTRQLQERVAQDTDYQEQVRRIEASDRLDPRDWIAFRHI